MPKFKVKVQACHKIVHKVVEVESKLASTSVSTARAVAVSDGRPWVYDEEVPYEDTYVESIDKDVSPVMEVPRA